MACRSGADRAVDGLTALGRWDRDEYVNAGRRPAAGRADRRRREGTGELPRRLDSRQPLPGRVGPCAAYKERLGPRRLPDRRQVPRPAIAISLFNWGLYNSRAEVLEQKYGDIDWNVIHDAATQPAVGPNWAASRRGASSSSLCRTVAQRRRPGRYDRRRPAGY